MVSTMALTTIKYLTLFLVCVSYVPVGAVLCTSCLYDEGVSYTINRTCLTDPSSMPTEDCTFCITAAGLYGVGNTLRVYRGCNDSVEYDWDNSCRFHKFNVVYNGYVCTCNNYNHCNTNDTDYRRCYQCNSIEDPDCYADLTNNSPVPCLTGYDNCVMETMEPYPHHDGAYDGMALYDYVKRYCSEREYGYPGLYVDYYLKSLNCFHSCGSYGCNDMADVCIIDKTIECKKCAYEADNQDTSEYACLTDPQSVSTTECYSQCYTKGWYTETGSLNIARGCDRDLSYDWLNSCHLIDGKYYVCTCNSSDYLCNGDNLGFQKCYQCDSRKDIDCVDDTIDSMELLPCVTGQSGCITEAVTPYPKSKDLTEGNENFNYVKRHCVHGVNSPYFYCKDYQSLSLQCIHACTDDGCTYKHNECTNTEDITNPITCISCEYNSASPNADKACLIDPSSSPTILCDSRCITRAYSQSGTLWIYRGCDCENEYDWKNSCKDVNVDDDGVANVCTCDNKDLCNADDSDKHLCYQCDSRTDSDCYAALIGNMPAPCLLGNTRCVTEKMEPYEEYTVGYGISAYDYIVRYCSNQSYGPEGLCRDHLGASLLCYYSCDDDGCNDIKGKSCVSQYNLGVLSLLLLFAYLQA
ncbi:uncharacterized protein LOC144440237 [Glandiceps talaboti]